MEPDRMGMEPLGAAAAGVRLYAEMFAPAVDWGAVWDTQYANHQSLTLREATEVQCGKQWEPQFTYIY